VIDVGDEAVDEDDPAWKALEARKSSDRVALIKRDPLQAYMQEVRRYPLLTPDEEHALATRLVEHGDSTAARKLIEANLRLVVKIAYEYRRAHKNLLDLVQEGNIGLMQAVRKYDPYRGVKLSSYAAFWIRAYILKFILNNWRLVKIGTTQAQRKLFFNLRKERERLEQLGFQPTTALLAENLQVSEKDVDEMERRLAAPEASLDAPMPGDDDGSRSRLDFLPERGRMRPDQAVAQGEFAALLREQARRLRRDARGPRADDLPRALADRVAADLAGAGRALRRVARARAPAREAHARPAAQVPRGRARHRGRHRRAVARVNAMAPGTLWVVATADRQPRRSVAAGGRGAARPPT
jgi:RNA polymerase sigma-32 factor